MRSSMICTAHQIFSGQIKDSERDRVCGTYGGEEKCIQGFGGET
jgi:hypothetical protein